MDDRTRELIAIGASVTANCQSCLTHHIAEALQAGIGSPEIEEAVAVARMVRKGALSAMDRFVTTVKGASEASATALAPGQGCSCGGA